MLCLSQAGDMKLHYYLTDFLKVQALFSMEPVIPGLQGYLLNQITLLGMNSLI